MTAGKGSLLEWPKGCLDFSSACLVMGILNITPDSFSDGGQFLDANRAIAHGLQMAAQAAATIYSIKADDLALRKTEAETIDKRGKYFDALRKNYPVRREFHNTTVVLDDPNHSLAAKFKGIGFNVR